LTPDERFHNGIRAMTSGVVHKPTVWYQMKEEVIEKLRIEEMTINFFNKKQHSFLPYRVARSRGVTPSLKQF
jgi:hypothetical protein